MSWHQVILTNEDISIGKNVALEDRFHELWEAAGSPRGMALFRDHYPQARTNGQVGMQMTYYFSLSLLPEPDVHYLVSAYCATPCEKPHWTGRRDEGEGLRLLWGHPDA